jgi:hypothetical protein
VLPRSHPYWHVRAVVERSRETVVAVPASYYSYRAQTVEDKRITFDIPVDHFLDPDRAASYLSHTPANHEMAIHSDLRLANRRRVHLIMIDMATGSRAHVEKVRSFLGEQSFSTIVWYRSGRSFHGYGETLLIQEEWIRFMGLLLLANQPRLDPTVDPRWIGHRLLAGYAALRWTKNTDQYLSLPTLVETRIRSRHVPMT